MTNVCQHKKVVECHADGPCSCAECGLSLQDMVADLKTALKVGNALYLDVCEDAEEAEAKVKEMLPIVAWVSRLTVSNRNGYYVLQAQEIVQRLGREEE